MGEVTNGTINSAHYGPAGDAARNIASYCEGDARAHVYAAAFTALTTAQAEIEALRARVAVAERVLKLWQEMLEDEQYDLGEMVEEYAKVVSATLTERQP